MNFLYDLTAARLPSQQNLMEVHITQKQYFLLCLDEQKILLQSIVVNYI